MPDSGIIFVVTDGRRSPSQDDRFTYECREAHKTRREYLKAGGVTILSHEHYVDGNHTGHDKEEGARSGATGAPPPRCADLYEVDTIEPLLSGKVLLEEGGDGPLTGVHSYVYKTMSQFGETAAAASSSTKPKDLALVSFAPPLTVLDEFHRWYEEEHVPMLSKVPGWMSTTRAKLLLVSSEGEQDAPKYAAFHRYSGPTNGLGTSKEWHDSVSTEWSKKVKDVIDREGKRTRFVWTFEDTHHKE